MMEFTFTGFIAYTFFVVICSCLLTITFPKIERKKNKRKDSNERQGEKLKVGGIYGKRRFGGDNNDPFSPIREYSYFVAIIDIKPSRDGHCDYCQYVFLNDNMSPYSSYSNTIIYSDITKKFDDWDYIKDIDLESIKIS